MLFRKVLAGILIIGMASPAFAASDALGNVTLSNVASVRDTKLTPGSTVFSGDAISVGENGSLRIALTGGAQAEILSDSAVRLAKSGDTVQVLVDRGQMSFHTSGANKIEGLLADATVRPADSNEVAAIIQSFGDRHAVVASEKGTLLVTTIHDARTITVHEGEAADLTVAPDDADGTKNGGPVSAGKTTPGIGPTSRKTVLWVGAVIVATTVITAYLLSRKEKSQPNIANEISPTKID